MARLIKLRSFLKRYRWIAIIAAAVVVLASLMLAPTAYAWAYYFGSAPTGLFGLPLLAESGGESAPNAEAPEATLSSEILQQTEPGISLPEPWDGAERVTILIMGLDYRDWSQEQGGPSHTDTMMLLSVDPVAKTASMLSVPRDLWAVIPGFTPNKINTAFYYGELYKLPGGGPELAMRTVEQTVGVPIDYYAQIDFDAFIRFIDLIGGVKIDVLTPITVDPLGSDTNPKNLKAGRQVLPGAVALAYARERHVEGGDFSRAQRQQQVVLGIRDRILEFDLLPGLVANAPQLYAELSAGIHTNLPLDDAIRLAILALQIQSQDIKQGVINEKYVVFGRSPDDLSILLPLPDKIRALRDELFTGNTALGPLTPGSAAERVAAEAARISIQNGTSDATLGPRAQAHLASLGANVVEVISASAVYAQTMLVDHTGNPYTLAYLAQLMGIPNARIIHEFDPNSPIDVEVQLGSDPQTVSSIP